MAKGMADRHPLLCVCSVFVGLVLRDGVQVCFYIFGFLGPLGLDSGRFTTPFLKCVSSNFSKKTNNPNPSPIKKIWFGLYWFGAGGGARTRTVVMPRDFKTSTESRREKTYKEVNAKNPCDCKALNGNWRKLEATRKRAFFLEKSDSERKRRERAKNKQAFLPMTNSDDKRKRHEEKSCILSKAVSGIP